MSPEDSQLLMEVDYININKFQITKNRNHLEQNELTFPVYIFSF